jgi:hypothetical protein
VTVALGSAHRTNGPDNNSAARAVAFWSEEALGKRGSPSARQSAILSSIITKALLRL